jgi:hypothetical protein
MSKRKTVKVTPDYIRRIIEEEKSLLSLSRANGKKIKRNDTMFMTLEERRVLQRVMIAELRARFLEEHPDLVNENIFSDLGGAVTSGVGHAWDTATDWVSSLTPSGVVDTIGDPLLQTFKADLGRYVIQDILQVQPGPLQAVLVNIFEQIPVSEYYSIYNNWDTTGCYALTGYIVDGCIEALILEPMTGALMDAMSQTVGIFAIFDQYTRSARTLQEYLNGIVQETDLYIGFQEEVEQKVCGIDSSELGGIVSSALPSGAGQMFGLVN